MPKKREYRAGSGKTYSTHKTDPRLVQELFERWGIIGKRKERNDEQDAVPHQRRT